MTLIHYPGARSRASPQGTAPDLGQHPQLLLLPHPHTCHCFWADTATGHILLWWRQSEIRKSGNPGLAEPWGPSRDGLGLPSWCTCSSGSPSPASCPLPELRCAKGWIRVWPKLSRSSCSAQWTCCSASLAPLHLALALLLEQRAVSLPSHFCPAQRAPPTDQSPAFSPSHGSRRRYLWPLWTPFS